GAARGAGGGAANGLEERVPQRGSELGGKEERSMFRIGDFSRIARVSARLLRFYDEIGLLAPAHADPQTGYRHYTVAQLAQLNRITVLKDLGFSLEQIGDILRSQLDAEELRRMLQLRRNDVERSLAEEAQ